jgi:5-methylcytosine-specific restriction protein A
MPDSPPRYGRKRTTARRGGSATLRDTSAAYERQRVAMLDNDPLCRYCFNRGHVTAATIADHIVALSLGGSNDPANLAPACKACNDAKAIDERRYAARGYDLGSVAYDPAMSVWLRLAQIRTGS